MRLEERVSPHRERRPGDVGLSPAGSELRYLSLTVLPFCTPALRSAEVPGFDLSMFSWPAPSLQAGAAASNGRRWS